MWFRFGPWDGEIILYYTGGHLKAENAFCLRSDGDTASEEWLMKFSGAGFGDGGRGPQIKEYESLENLLESEKVKEVDSALKLPDKCAALTVF